MYPRISVSQIFSMGVLRFLRVRLICLAICCLPAPSDRNEAEVVHYISREARSITGVVVDGRPSTKLPQTKTSWCSAWAENIIGSLKSCDDQGYLVFSLTPTSWSHAGIRHKFNFKFSKTLLITSPKASGSVPSP